MTILTNTKTTKVDKDTWRRDCLIEDFSEKVDVKHCLLGWIHDLYMEKTSDGLVSLVLVLRDYTGLLLLYIKDNKLIELAINLKRESVIAVKLQGKEITDLKIIASAKSAPLKPYAITDYSSLDLVINRPFALRTERMKAVLRIQSKIFSSVRDVFQKEGFFELRSPIISPATDPGIRGANYGEVDYYGKKYKITTSMILYKQMAICSLEKIYSFSPNVRLEQIKTQMTGSHLAEFCQIDVEWAFSDYNDVMNLAEKLLVAILKDIQENQKDLEILKREPIIPKPPFRKITYNKAIDLLNTLNVLVDNNKQEIPWEAEFVLSKQFDEPFWIIDYPIGSRGFYDRINPENPQLLKSFDLMYPNGYGEAISGSEREYQYELVKKKLIKQGLELTEYQWYLDMLQRGVPPSAGFGMGLERLTRYICGLEKIWEATAFPKVPGVYSP